MAYNVINQYQTFRDSTGEVRANGKVTFYNNLTTDLASIWSDEALTVSQSNPYTLDAFGRITGDVKYKGLLTLKIQNADLSDTRTDDNVASLEPTVDNIELTYTTEIASHSGTPEKYTATWYDNSKATDSGGALIFTGITTAGKAGNGRDTDGYFYNANGNKYQIDGGIKVKRFGALGDDSTNDTVALQAAYTYAEAVGSGEVFWGDDTYVFSTLNISSNIETVGESKGGTIAKRISSYTTDGLPDESRTEAMFNAWVADDLTGGFTDIVFRNMTIDGNESNLTVTDGTKLNTISASNLEMKLVNGLYIENCIIKNGLKNGVYAAGCSNFQIENSTVKDNGTQDFPAVSMSRNGLGFRGAWYNDTTSLAVKEDKTGHRVRNCEISGNTEEGIAYSFANDITITGNHIFDNLDKGIEGNTANPGGDLADVIITHNTIYNNTDIAIAVANSPTIQNLVISDNIIRDCGSSAITVELTDFATDGGKLIIADNIIDNIGITEAATSSLHAIFANGYDVDIHDNILTDSNYNGITVRKFKSVSVHDNTVKAVVAGINYKGISINIQNGGAGADSVSVYENTITGFSGAASGAIRILPAVAETIKSVNISNNRGWDMRQLIDIGDANLTITSIDVINNYGNSGIDTFNDFLDINLSTITTMYCLGNNPTDAVNQLISDKSVITTLIQSDNGKNPETLDAGLTAAPSGGSHKTGEKVWKTNPVVAGGGGSQYVIIGWIYISAAWVEMRVLTGT